MAVITGAVIAGVAVAGSIASSVQAGKERKKAGRIQKAIAQLENAQTRRNQIRNFRIQQSVTIARAAATGGAGGGFGALQGSGITGESLSLATQVRANLKFLDESTKLSHQASTANLAAAAKDTQANVFSGVASAAVSVSSLFAASPQ
jgi:hypothetical protein